ncbi:hypothetical protein [Chryseobacterium scophthalmum]|uniref:hypothetical protein n=1 Tax=Chryseobacterium scophthalmum TaxID=59733 RepID=UPI001AEBF661|nr:hypothetical protein [Chryseobacterium scophthalmum]
MGKPICGEHHNLYNIEETLEEISDLLDAADIECKGLFINVDSDLTVKKLEICCIKKKL